MTLQAARISSIMQLPLIKVNKKNSLCVARTSVPDSLLSMRIEKHGYDCSEATGPDYALRDLYEAQKVRKHISSSHFHAGDYMDGNRSSILPESLGE